MTDITELSQSLRRRAASANEFGEGLFFIKADDVLALLEALEKAQQRITQLESRTVKLPKCHSMLLREDFNEDYHTEMAYKADEVHASLAAAGIKVEAE
ncbi:hypothetical protein ACR2XU_24440 [Klebsiella pneumoniae]